MSQVQVKETDWTGFIYESTGCIFPQSSYLGGLVDVDSVVQSQTLKQLHVTAPLQTSKLEENGDRQQLQNKKETFGSLVNKKQTNFSFFFKGPVVILP